ncbi:MAG: SBBP repeat-containing protein [Bryobacteraceae bacterium]|nr:SBBP repeat-containing protein [Bryobacteraceae bacterium]MDW8378697.1 SBBP repeat-containing protein [Bryobacterales bacterium]
MVLLSETSIEYRAGADVIRLIPQNARGKKRLEGLAPTGGQSHYLKGAEPASWRTKIPHYRRVLCKQLYPGIDLVFYSTHQGYEFDFLVAPGANPEQIRVLVDGAQALEVVPSGDLLLKTPQGRLVLRKPFVYQWAGGKKKPVPASYALRGPEFGFALGDYDRTVPLVIDPITSSYLGGRDIDIVNGVALDASSHIYVTGYTTSTDFARSASPLKATLAAGDSDAFVMKLNPAGTAIIYSTFLGGNAADVGRAIAVDGTGSAYITGSTIGRFPITAGVIRQTTAVAPAIFVAKLTPSGDALSYATYLDGAGSGQTIQVDATGNAYVGGFTYTATFTTTSAAVQPSYGGATDGFVTKLNPTATALAYSTFLGGAGEDQVTGLRVDSAGAVYVTGFTSSSNFPTTSGALRTSYAGATDAFVSKLNPAGSSLLYSTFLGGSNTDRALAIDIDSSGHAYVTGQTASTNFPTTSGVLQASFAGGAFDAFVSKLNPAATALSFSTFLGGTGDCNLADPFRLYQCDSGQSISVDASQRVFVTGFAGAGFPLVSADQPSFGGNGDAFVAQVNPSASELLMSTYLGGNGGDIGLGIVRGPNLAVVVGMTTSANFPVTSNALQGTSGGGTADGFLATYGNCSYSLGSTGSFFPNNAASYSIDLFTGAGCPWTATASDSWITLTDPSGSGSGVIRFSLTPNGGGLRTGTITVQGQVYTIQQVGGACVVTLGASESWFPAQAGTYSVPVFAGPGCSWSATAQESWITLIVAAGSGNGQFQFALSQNATSSARTGSISVTGGNVYTVRQVGGPPSLACNYSLNRYGDVFDVFGGSSSIFVNTTPGCEWSTLNPNDWILITAGFAGSGPGVVGYTLRRNRSGQTRVGQIIIAGQAVTIVQLAQ